MAASDSAQCSTGGDLEGGSGHEQPGRCFNQKSGRAAEVDQQAGDPTYLDTR
jgi:hypothetical protein